MANKVQIIKNQIMNIKSFYVYLFAIISSLLTFLFFYVTKNILTEDKIVKENIDIYQNRGWKVISLGSRNNPEMLFNFYREVIKYENVISSELGSAVFYALYLKKKVKVMFEINGNNINGNKNNSYITCETFSSDAVRFYTKKLKFKILGKKIRFFKKMLVLSLKIK